MLASVIVNAVDAALDVVLAHTAAVMACQSKARARVGRQVAERVTLCWPTPMGEPPPTQRTVGDLTKSSTAGERDLGDQIVNTRKIVVGRSHALTMTTSSS